MQVPGIEFPTFSPNHLAYYLRKYRVQSKNYAEANPIYLVRQDISKHILHPDISHREMFIRSQKILPGLRNDLLAAFTGQLSPRVITRQLTEYGKLDAENHVPECYECGNDLDLSYHYHECSRAAKCDECDTRTDIPETYHSYACSRATFCDECGMRSDIPGAHIYKCSRATKCNGCGVRTDIPRVQHARVCVQPMTFSTESNAGNDQIPNLIDNSSRVEASHNVVQDNRHPLSLDALLDLLHTVASGRSCDYISLSTPVEVDQIENQANPDLPADPCPSEKLRSLVFHACGL